MPATDPDRTCPSAQPHLKDARVIGVVLGEGATPRVAYLEKGVTVSVDDLESLADVRATRVLRFAARCESGSCAQFRDGACRLGRDVVAMVGQADSTPPACSIRRTCRWFAENGPSVCLRCSRVVTDPARDDAVLMTIAAKVHEG